MCGLILRTGGHQGSVRGYLYANSGNNVGFLTSDGNWQIRCNNSEVELYDTSYANDFRTYITYDRDNTGYYVNPNSESNLYRTSTYLAGKYTTGDWADGFRNTPTSSYNFHGDISSGGPAGTWWFYESMRHGNGSNYWGTQIAWGWEDNSNRLMQRNITANSFSGWVEYLNTGGRTFSGSLTMSGTITAYSDIKLKEKIEVIPDALNKLTSIRGVTFTRNDVDDKNKRHAGVIAQEVERVLPEVILMDADGVRSVAYGNMVGLLIEAIKELRLELNQLKSFVKL